MNMSIQEEQEPEGKIQTKGIALTKPRII